jgi:RNA polymerase sigma factor (TIGR02999 family)
MTDTGPEAVARLLDELQRGNRRALADLFPLIYDELKVLAGWQRQRWHGDLTLNTTALVHEAYLKLVGQERIGATSRAHFLGVAAKAMRHILCNYARDRQRQKRGGDMERVSGADLLELPDTLTLTSERAETLLALDRALEDLEKEMPRLEEVVECRFFGGLSIDDTAAALDMSPATIKRHWTLARSWLYRRLTGADLP